MEMPVYKGLAFSLDELLPTVAHALGNGGGYPGWIMQLYIWIGNQVPVLFKVVGNADHSSMSFDDEAVEVGHVQPQVKMVLSLKRLQ